MNAPLNAALNEPGPTFAVRIFFTAGIYEACVEAPNWELARQLALTSARTTAGKYNRGKVLSISADRPP